MAENIVRQRAVVKGKLTRLKNFVSELDVNGLDADLISQLNERLQKFEPSWEDFNQLQTELEVLQPSDNDETERELFENAYFELVGKIKAIIKQHDAINPKCSDNDSNIDSTVSNQSINFTNNASVKLPTIKLPTFDGQYCNWLEFRDAFSALVDTNNTIHNIQKFYYLRCSLQGDASQIIKSIEVSAENYKNAWQLLVERYENKSLIIHNHIKAMFDHPSMQKESHIELRKLFDDFSKHLRSLKTLGEQTDAWDRLIIFILTNKFDAITRRDWESHKCEGDLPTMKDLNEFLKSKCDVLEKLEVNKVDKVKSQGRKCFVVSEGKLSCHNCKKSHPIYQCEDFLNLSIDDRINTIKKLKLCLNCFKDSHFVGSCKARRCFKCNRLHNSLLHKSFQKRNTEPENKGNEVVNVQSHTDNTNDTTNVAISSSSLLETTTALPVISQVLLSTAIINITNNDRVITCRALLDSGSQSNFVTENICKKLNLHTQEVNFAVKGIGKTLKNISRQVRVTVMSVHGNFKTNIACLILPKITEMLPAVSFDKEKLNIPNDIQLADKTFHLSSDIDILLGSNVFWSVLSSGQRCLGKNLPILQNTKLGWIVAGDIHTSHVNLSVNHIAVDFNDHSINDEIERFWSVEEVYESNLTDFYDINNYCEQHFVETTKRDDTGRFIVKIPFKESLRALGKSRDIAINRFYSLEKRFENNLDLKTEYVKFMREYESLNHMTKISDSHEEEGYYIPHHAVLKTSSLTTKCRVVFDASAKTDSGLSLNDVQFNGPVLQNDLLSILLRFRSYKFVVTADVAKMYRQVLVDPTQRKYQKIFWREDSRKNLDCYELNTITYGCTSAPYMAIRALTEIGIKNKDRYPVVSKIIINDFYVDDLITGANSMAEIIQIQHDTSKLLASAGFELRKWLSNDMSLIKHFQIDKELDSGILCIGDNEIKTLGIYWKASSDVIQYRVNKRITDTDRISKRTILSSICQIFDPLGLLGPIVIVAKLIIQELWKLKASWDDLVPNNLRHYWDDFQNSLNVINEIQIQRFAFISDWKEIQLHGFCDASEKAYGACIYVRCINSEGNINSNLLCAKSRVAPLKQLTLPRLELSGAVLLANLVQKVVKSLDIKFESISLWTDSTVTLAWIRDSPNRWKTFVANRVSEIQTLTNAKDWHHVKSKENPADLLSRGINAKKLIDSRLWWNGPFWLSKSVADWKTNEINMNFDIPEEKIIVNIGTVNYNEILNLLNTFSSISKCERILAYMLRFVNNVRKTRELKRVGALTPVELETSINQLVEIVQRVSFSREYRDLSNNREINRGSKILGLNPFLHNNLIRVGGRIGNSNCAFDKKHPVLLPQGHKLTSLIIEREHKRLLHCGVQTLLGSIREKYWPISGRNICKKVVRGCVVCIKAKPKPVEYLMGSLPEVRISNHFPFLNVGVDYAGPFLLKDRVTRGAKTIKAYVCLIICMSTKCVHLEVVSDLSTQVFLGALKRFISRRGRPANIYSDNGSNFVGANKEIENLFIFLRSNGEIFAEELAKEKIGWHFIPARSPNFGGIWEAGIKSTKFHVKRVIGNTLLTFEEFYTIIVQIEGILNSRPLCPLSCDPEDLTALTPAHFLIGRTITAIPEVSVMDLPENRLKRHQRITAIMQHYWTRWSKEYLAELQTRSKWKQQSKYLLKVGTMVLVKNETTYLNNWRLGRITAVHPGRDDVVRVVDIKVADGVIRRSANKICVLPID